MPLTEERRAVLENIKLKLTIIINDMKMQKNVMKDMNNNINHEYVRIIESHWPDDDVQDEQIRTSLISIGLVGQDGPEDGEEPFEETARTAEISYQCLIVYANLHFIQINAEIIDDPLLHDLF
jgi:hypothetical protein